MRIHDLRDEEGHVFTFEIDNLNVGRKDVCAVVRAIPGATIIRGPKLFSWLREEEFCEFEIEGQRFKIWEPFGDNSRYWIGPQPPQWCSQVEIVRDAFVRHQPSLVPFLRLFR